MSSCHKQLSETHCLMLVVVRRGNFLSETRPLKYPEKLPDQEQRQQLQPPEELPPPIEREADDRVLLLQVVDYYNETLKQSPEALKYLASRGLTNSEMIDRFRLGFANRTLGYRLPAKNRAAGAEMRGRLQERGILRESGHEHFNGSVVIPVFNSSGEVVEMYGPEDHTEPAGGYAEPSLSTGRTCRRVERGGAQRVERGHPVRVAEVRVMKYQLMNMSRERALAEQPNEVCRKALQAAWRRYDRTAKSRLREAAEKNMEENVPE